MEKLLEMFNPPETVRAWIYRVLLLLVLGVVAAALLLGYTSAEIIATVSTVSAIVTATLATINTSRNPPAPPPAG